MIEGCFVGIDTSNYTTSLAITDPSGRVVANLKMPLSVKAGERGLRQSDAVFLHTKNLPLLFESAREYFENYKPVAIGVSSKPRSVEGSYMPCFLAGKSVAYSIASAMSLPVFEFSHQNGHIMAAAYSSGAMDKLLSGEFIAFHVSGGTTEVLHVVPNGYDFVCEKIGGTADINAGQLIDRVGVYMGIPFPCGPKLEKLALEYNGKTVRNKVVIKDGYCNLSGLENKAAEMFDRTKDKSAVSSLVLSFIGDTLAALTEFAMQRYPNAPVLYSGGVMSCSVLQKRLQGDRSYFAQPEFSADNAAGISLLTWKNYR